MSGLTKDMIDALNGRRGGSRSGNKFGARRTGVAGESLDSKWEAKRYRELMFREKAGEIRNLQRQVPVSLEVNGVTVGRWIADFVYEEGDSVAPRGATAAVRVRNTLTWSKVMEDTKSPPTRRLPDYRLKRAILAANGVFIREVVDPVKEAKYLEWQRNKRKSRTVSK